MQFVCVYVFIMCAHYACVTTDESDMDIPVAWRRRHVLCSIIPVLRLVHDICAHLDGHEH